MNTHFKTTRWSLVLSAAEGESTQSRQALDELCRIYWYPVYAFIRRRGYSAQDAQDLAQGYFALLLEKGYLQQVNPSRGRFRTFLLVSVKNFLANEYDKTQALKRGSQYHHFSLDAADAERRFEVEDQNQMNPERAFEHRWATTVADRAMALLQEDFLRRDEQAKLAQLKPFLVGEPQLKNYREIAQDLEMTEGAVKVAILRARRSYGEKLREVVGETVSDPKEIDDELRNLIQLLSQG